VAKALGILAGYLMSIPGFLLHLPVILFVLAWDRAFFRDSHLVPAARFALGMFVVPAWWIAAAGAGLLQGGLVTAALLLAAMPASLWLWSRTWHWTG
jgi:hypothetical protein